MPADSLAEIPGDRASLVLLLVKAGSVCLVVAQNDLNVTWWIIYQLSPVLKGTYAV